MTCSTRASSRPDWPQAWYDLGNALTGGGRWDDALLAYRQAILLDPGFAQAHNNLGSALGKKGEFDAAISEYRSAIALRPDLPTAFNNLGNAEKLFGLTAAV